LGLQAAVEPAGPQPSTFTATTTSTAATVKAAGGYLARGRHRFARVPGHGGTQDQHEGTAAVSLLAASHQGTVANRGSDEEGKPS
jgi:hypothetical protein